MTTHMLLVARVGLSEEGGSQPTSCFARWYGSKSGESFGGCLTIPTRKNRPNDSYALSHDAEDAGGGVAMITKFVCSLALLLVLASSACADQATEISISGPSTVKAGAAASFSIRLRDVYEGRALLGYPIFIGSGEKYYCNYGRYNSQSAMTLPWKAPRTPGRYRISAYWLGGWGFEATAKTVIVTVVK